MKSKKGLTEADWAMSMGIFMLYLAWFFIVIRPTVSPDTKITMPFDDLKESFYKEASWTVNRTPLIIRSNITGSNEPVIASFPYEGIEEQYSISGKYLKLDEGKLFFLADLFSRGDENTVLYYLLHSASNYTQPDMYSDLTSSEESASTADITVTFNDGLIQQAFFKDSVRILDFSISIDGNAIDTSNSIHSSNKLFSKHKVVTPQLNHSTYIILNNSRIYGYFNPRAGKEVSMSIRTDRYPYFYVNSRNGGSISYNQTECDQYTTNYLNLYDNAHGLSFIFDDDVSLKLCHYGNMTITAEFDAGGEFGYDLIFHERQDDTANMVQPYKLIFGAEEVLEGLSDEKLFYLEKKNYTDVKANWSYAYDFNITVTNASNNVIFSFGAIPTRYVTAEGRTYNYNNLDQSGSMQRVTTTLLSW